MKTWISVSVIALLWAKTVFVVDRNGNLHSTEARGQLEFILPTLLSNHAPKN